MGCAANTAVTAAEQERADCREFPSTHKSCPNFHRRYLLQEKIGEGSFACVYNCRRIDRPEDEVVVKITDLRRSKECQGYPHDLCLSWLQQEASLLKAAGDREHCCKFIDSMFDQRFYYLVMEKCSTTLRQALERMPELTERTLATVVKQMFIAVSEVHALRIVHRDVKPDSFLCVGPEATVKLSGFGFARRVPSGVSTIRGVFGSAPFMSPEMITGLGYAAPTDIWSLGVVLYVLLCGEFPYTPGSTCRNSMRAAVARGVPPPRFATAVAGAQLSAEAEELLRALLHRDPETRPQAAGALAFGWFRAAAEEAPVGELPSLRGALFAADRAGAFGPAGVSRPPSAHKGRPMPVVLQELQEKHQRKEVHGSTRNSHDWGGRTSSPARSDERAPPCPPKYPEGLLSPCARAPHAGRLGVVIKT